MRTIESNREALLNAVKSAVRHSVAMVRANHPGESLRGYALATDDGLQTLGYFASTDAVKSLLEANARFEPLDWTYNEGASAFDEPLQLLVSSADALAGEGLIDHVSSAFEVLVAAFREIREEGLFSDDVFLTVISTDPNKFLDLLEQSAVRTLNSAEVCREWEASVHG